MEGEPRWQEHVVADHIMPTGKKQRLMNAGTPAFLCLFNLEPQSMQY